MEQPIINTLKELKKTDYEPKTIQQELADNLRAKIANGETTFDGLVGYDNTVIPDVERAILSGHNINLLGLRGCLLYTSPSPRDGLLSRMPSSA